MEWGILTDRIKCYQVVTLPVRERSGEKERKAGEGGINNDDRKE